jgi:hypothetical protein
MSDCTLNGNPPYDCSGCDLTGQHLAGKDLTNAKFQGAILTGTIFRGAKSLAGAPFHSQPGQSVEQSRNRLNQEWVRAPSPPPGSITFPIRKVRP